jgi:putative ABC transport system permease protein
MGIYGVMSYSVSQRTHEIGVRMAMGAERGGVLRQVITRGLLLTVVGVVLGIAASLGLTRFISSQLYGVSATDPMSFAGISLLLVGVALAACYIPARKAARADPLVALRHE